jgi:hypothetical protein
MKIGHILTSLIKNSIPNYKGDRQSNEPFLEAQNNPEPALIKSEFPKTSKFISCHVML